MRNFFFQPGLKLLSPVLNSILDLSLFSHYVHCTNLSARSIQCFSSSVYALIKSCLHGVGFNDVMKRPCLSQLQNKDLLLFRLPNKMPCLSCKLGFEKCFVLEKEGANKKKYLFATITIVIFGVGLKQTNQGHIQQHWRQRS